MRRFLTDRSGNAEEGVPGLFLHDSWTARESGAVPDTNGAENTRRS